MSRRGATASFPWTTSATIARLGGNNAPARNVVTTTAMNVATIPGPRGMSAVATVMSPRPMTSTTFLPHRVIALAPEGLPKACERPIAAVRYAATAK